MYLVIESCGKVVISSGMTYLRLIVIHGNDAESNVGEVKPMERVTQDMINHKLNCIRLFNLAHITRNAYEIIYRYYTYLKNI